MTDETEIERRQLERQTLDAAFHLAMKVRTYLGALDPHDPLLRQWVLRQLEEQLPALATAVIVPLTTIEDIDFFDEHAYPRV